MKPKVGDRVKIGKCIYPIWLSGADGFITRVKEREAVISFPQGVLNTCTNIVIHGPYSFGFFEFEIIKEEYVFLPLGDKRCYCGSITTNDDSCCCECQSKL